MVADSFSHVTTWVFDLDNTLYPPSARLFDQIEVKMTDWVMRTLNVDRAEADRLRALYWDSHGTTLAGLMEVHGIDPDGYLYDVHDISFHPLEADAVLADRIAAQVKAWLEDGHALTKGGKRRASAGDIMILVRKRRALAGLIVARLHAAGVPVAGVDRLRLGAPLAADAVLADRIAALPGRRIVYTNATEPYARNVLAARGLSEVFDAVYGVEHAGFQPKPRRAAFDAVFAADGLDPATAAMFEDDARNLAVPHNLGMRTVHVAPTPIKAAHIHHHTDDLSDFLSQLGGLAAARDGATS